MRGVVLDLAAQLQRGLELRPDPYAGGDFLGEDLLAADAVRFQGIELGLEFLGEVRAAGVAYPDISARFFPSTTVTPWGRRTSQPTAGPTRKWRSAAGNHSPNPAKCGGPPAPFGQTGR